MAIIGVGAKLEYESGSGWAEVANCKSVNFPGFNVTSVETTNLSNVDFGKSYIPGMIDGNTITFSCEFTDANYTALSGLVRDLLGWRVSSPSGESVTVTCDGFLTSLEVALAPDEEVMINGTIKMTGVPSVS